ncbi:conserved hypothetical protein [Leishmania mexicana MHOM/GT/2001/U1103]|uniref:Dynein heavy chain n=1 Tax=Leishmania mexicana (strain MHOM/GT/2001/U1103) TaxID=929439 RepID=E9B4K9_LEIMU|nr:conserved hypothetical protein [Leishmania mexicana MHOM/GT/2001/U1103]CBZ30178.1 conserved hypothetical protein [Leishmania mexicana MHOM/GT/2001/U1103]
MSARPSDELARLQEELEQEEQDLAALEDNVEAHAVQLGYLHTEYTLNKTRVCQHYEPRLEPLRVITYATAQKEALIAFQIEWLERKIVMQERRSQGGQFIETRDMKPAAEEYQKKAQQSLLRCYEHISECPEDALHIISQYVCPPEEAIETMELVMKVRGEPPEACTWEASQVLFSHTYFHEFFATRSEGLLKKYDLLSDELMTEVEGFCADPHHSVSALYRISIPIGCMGEWLHSIRNYYRVKLVTAPVLLSQSADTGRMAKQAQAWLAAVTLGEVRDRTPPQQQTTAAKHAVTEDAELGALVAAYEASKEHLQLTTEPASVTAATLQKLRHRLHKLRESVRTAEEERIAIEGELQAKLAEVRGNYDETMVPLEDQLEEMTECFVQRVTQQWDVAAAPPSPTTAAASIADNAPAVAAAG